MILFYYIEGFLTYAITFLFVTGDITQKGYEKKKTRLLAPYVPKQPQGAYTIMHVYRNTEFFYLQNLGGLHFFVK